MMRGGELAGVRAFRNNSGGVDIPVNNVIVLFDLLKIRGVTEAWRLVEVAEVAPEMRHVADAVAVALEMVVVHGVETHQGGEQANISLGDAITHEVTVIGQALLKGV